MVVEVKTNADKAEKEINEAEKVTRGSNKLIAIISFIIIFVIVSIVLIVYFVFKSK